MFIRSSTAINDCLIALDSIYHIEKYEPIDARAGIKLTFKSNVKENAFVWGYENTDVRDKAYEELCAFLNCNYKLRDFT